MNKSVLTPTAESEKLVPYEQAIELFAEMREDGICLVQCHGTFDLIHPGHIIHLEEARSLGDKLVVTVTAESHVNKGPGRPYFNDSLRGKSLTALQCVDYVVIIPFAAAVEAIECVQPAVYCKGEEYADPSNDVTGNIADDVLTVARLGGQVKYIGSVVFSSTRLLNNNFSTLDAQTQQFCQRLSGNLHPDGFCEIVEGFSDMKILVLGDIIFDRYTTVNVQGLTSKGQVLSSRFKEDEIQAGGALAVFRHLSEFSGNVKLMSVVGSEPWVEETLSQYVPAGADEIVRSSEFTTVVKQRFVEPLSPGKELNKLFSINYMNEQYREGAAQRSLCERFEAIVDEFDLVLVMDFGHGVMLDKIRELAQSRSRFLAVNCQTNSNNYGFNLINRQYRNVDCFTLDEAELTLAVSRRKPVFEKELRGMCDFIGAQYAWLTRGGSNTLGLQPDREYCELKALEQSVVDTVGAGDAFCALASMCAARGLNIEVGTFLGQLAGAQAVKIVGNRECISKSKLLKAGVSLLSY